MMNSLLLLIFVLVVYAAAFWLVYPAWVKNNVQRLLVADSLLTLGMLLLLAWRFAGTGMRFNLLLLELSWFWTALLFYLLAMVLFLPAYCRRFGIQLRDFGF